MAQHKERGMNAWKTKWIWNVEQHVDINIIQTFAVLLRTRVLYYLNLANSIPRQIFSILQLGVLAQFPANQGLKTKFPEILDSD